MLLMHCGQILAQPLLSCCDFMDQMPDNEKMESHDHASMQMSHDTLDSHKMPLNNFSESEESNCNYHCDFCVLLTIALIENNDFNQPNLTESIILLKNYSLLSTTTKSLFRPPISA